MRAICFLFGVGLVGLGCGGSGGAAKPADPAKAAAAAAGASKAKGDPGPPEYCERYSGCAREKRFFELRRELPEGADDDAVPEDRLAELVKEDVERCEGIVKDLSPEQSEWLESCTGCGGSCDVYDCLDRVPDEVTEPYQCTLFEQPPEEPPPEE